MRKRGFKPDKFTCSILVGTSWGWWISGAMGLGWLGGWQISNHLTFPFSPSVESAQVKAFCKSGQTVNEAVVRRGNASVPSYFPASQESVDRALALLDESNDCLEHRNWDPTVSYKSGKGSWIDGMISFKIWYEVWIWPWKPRSTTTSRGPVGTLLLYWLVLEKVSSNELQICWGFGRHHQGANFQTEILGLKGGNKNWGRWTKGAQRV